MKYIINESRLDDIVTKYISKTIGEYRELPTNNNYYAGFYKDGECNALFKDQMVILDYDYYDTMYKLFGDSSVETLSKMILKFVNQYPHPDKIERVTLFSTKHQSY